MNISKTGKYVGGAILYFDILKSVQSALSAFSNLLHRISGTSSDGTALVIIIIGMLLFFVSVYFQFKIPRILWKKIESTKTRRQGIIWAIFGFVFAFVLPWIIFLAIFFLTTLAIALLV